MRIKHLLKKFLIPLVCVLLVVTILPFSSRTSNVVKAAIDVGENPTPEVDIVVQMPANYPGTFLDFKKEMTEKLIAMGVPEGAFRITSSAVSIDATDLSDWYVYNHYYNETQYNNLVKELTSDQKAKHPYSLADNTYTTAVSGHDPLSLQYAEEQYLSGGTNYFGSCRNFDQHIYSYQDSKGLTNMVFVGYGTKALNDYMIYPAASDSRRTFSFDMDASKVGAHTLTGAGFLMNAGINDSGVLNGYALFFTGMSSSSSSATANLLKITNATASSWTNNNSTLNKTAAVSGTSGVSVSLGSVKKLRFTVDLQKDKVTVQYQTYSSDGSLSDPVTLFGGAVKLDANGYNGFGPVVAYKSHGCSELTSYRFMDLEMSYEADAFDALKAAQYYEGADQKYFINLGTNGDASIPENSDVYQEGINRMITDEIMYISNVDDGYVLYGENTMTSKDGTEVSTVRGIAGNIHDNGVYATGQNTVDEIATYIANNYFDSVTFDTTAHVQSALPLAAFTMVLVDPEFEPDYQQIQNIHVQHLVNKNINSVNLRIKNRSVANAGREIFAWKYFITNPNGDVVYTSGATGSDGWISLNKNNWSDTEGEIGDDASFFNFNPTELKDFVVNQSTASGTWVFSLQVKSRTAGSTATTGDDIRESKVAEQRVFILDDSEAPTVSVENTPNTNSKLGGATITITDHGDGLATDGSLYTDDDGNPIDWGSGIQYYKFTSAAVTTEPTIPDPDDPKSTDYIYLSTPAHEVVKTINLDDYKENGLRVWAIDECGNKLNEFVFDTCKVIIMEQTSDNPITHTQSTSVNPYYVIQGEKLGTLPTLGTGKKGSNTVASSFKTTDELGNVKYIDFSGWTTDTNWNNNIKGIVTENDIIPLGTKEIKIYPQYIDAHGKVKFDVTSSQALYYVPVLDENKNPTGEYELGTQLSNLPTTPDTGLVVTKFGAESGQSDTALNPKTGFLEEEKVSINLSLKSVINSYKAGYDPTKTGFHFVEWYVANDQYDATYTPEVKKEYPANATDEQKAQIDQENLLIESRNKINEYKTKKFIPVSESKNIIREDETITVYAQFERDTYKLVLDANGGTLGANRGSDFLYQESLDDYIASSSEGRFAPTRQGYIFQGWSETPTGTTKVTTKTMPVCANGTYTLYAIWTEDSSKFRVTFQTMPYGQEDKNAATLSENGYKKNPDTSKDVLTYKASPLPTPTRSGYVFAGWYYLDVDQNNTVNNSDNKGKLVYSVSELEPYTDSGVTYSIASDGRVYTTYKVTETQSVQVPVLDENGIQKEDENGNLLYTTESKEVEVEKRKYARLVTDNDVIANVLKGDTASNSEQSTYRYDHTLVAGWIPQQTKYSIEYYYNNGTVADTYTTKDSDNNEVSHNVYSYTKVPALTINDSDTDPHRDLTGNPVHVKDSEIYKNITVNGASYWFNEDAVVSVIRDDSGNYSGTTGNITEGKVTANPTLVLKLYYDRYFDITEKKDTKSTGTGSFTTTDTLTKIKEGESRTVSWKADEDSEVTSVVVGSTLRSDLISNEGSYTFTDIRSNDEITVTFTKKSSSVVTPPTEVKTIYKITTSLVNNSDGSNTITPTTTINKGSDHNVKVALTDGYSISKFEVDGVDFTAYKDQLTNGTGYQFLSVDADHTVVVTLKKDTSLGGQNDTGYYSVTVNVYGLPDSNKEDVEISPSKNFKPGEEYVVTYKNKDSGEYEIYKVLVNGTETSGTSTVFTKTGTVDIYVRKKTSSSGGGTGTVDPTPTPTDEQIKLTIKVDSVVVSEVLYDKVDGTAGDITANFEAPTGKVIKTVWVQENGVQTEKSEDFKEEESGSIDFVNVTDNLVVSITTGEAESDEPADPSGNSPTPTTGEEVLVKVFIDNVLKSSEAIKKGTDVTKTIDVGSGKTIAAMNVTQGTAQPRAITDTNIIGKQTASLTYNDVQKDIIINVSTSGSLGNTTPPGTIPPEVTGESLLKIYVDGVLKSSVSYKEGTTVADFSVTVADGRYIKFIENYDENETDHHKQEFTEATGKSTANFTGITIGTNNHIVSITSTVIEGNNPGGIGGDQPSVDQVSVEVRRDGATLSYELLDKGTNGASFTKTVNALTDDEGIQLVIKHVYLKVGSGEATDILTEAEAAANLTSYTISNSQIKENLIYDIITGYVDTTDPGTGEGPGTDPVTPTSEEVLITYVIDGVTKASEKINKGANYTKNVDVANIDSVRISDGSGTRTISLDSANNVNLTNVTTDTTIYVTTKANGGDTPTPTPDSTDEKGEVVITYIVDGENKGSELFSNSVTTNGTTTYNPYSKDLTDLVGTKTIDTVKVNGSDVTLSGTTLNINEITGNTTIEITTKQDSPVTDGPKDNGDNTETTTTTSVAKENKEVTVDYYLDGEFVGSETFVYETVETTTTVTTVVTNKGTDQEETTITTTVSDPVVKSNTFSKNFIGLADGKSITKVERIDSNGTSTVSTTYSGEVKENVTFFITTADTKTIVIDENNEYTVEVYVDGVLVSKDVVSKGGSFTKTVKPEDDKDRIKYVYYSDGSKDEDGNIISSKLEELSDKDLTEVTLSATDIQSNIAYSITTGKPSTQDPGDITGPDNPEPTPTTEQILYTYILDGQTVLKELIDKVDGGNTITQAIDVKEGYEVKNAYVTIGTKAAEDKKADITNNTLTVNKVKNDITISVTTGRVGQNTVDPVIEQVERVSVQLVVDGATISNTSYEKGKDVTIDYTTKEGKVVNEVYVKDGNAAQVDKSEQFYNSTNVNIPYTNIQTNVVVTIVTGDEIISEDRIEYISYVAEIKGVGTGAQFTNTYLTSTTLAIVDGQGVDKAVEWKITDETIEEYNDTVGGTIASSKVNYVVDYITVNGTKIDSTSDQTYLLLENLTQNTKVEIFIKKIEYTVYLNAVGNGKISSTKTLQPDQSYLSITAKPNENSVIYKVEVDGKIVWTNDKVVVQSEEENTNTSAIPFLMTLRNLFAPEVVSADETDEIIQNIVNSTLMDADAVNISQDHIITVYFVDGVEDEDGTIIITEDPTDKTRYNVTYKVVNGQTGEILETSSALVAEGGNVSLYVNVPDGYLYDRSAVNSRVPGSAFDKDTMTFTFNNISEDKDVVVYIKVDDTGIEPISNTFDPEKVTISTYLENDDVQGSITSTQTIDKGTDEYTVSWTVNNYVKEDGSDTDYKIYYVYVDGKPRQDLVTDSLTGSITFEDVNEDHTVMVVASEKDTKPTVTDPDTGEVIIDPDDPDPGKHDDDDDGIPDGKEVKITTTVKNAVATPNINGNAAYSYVAKVEEGDSYQVVFATNDLNTVIETVTVDGVPLSGYAGQKSATIDVNNITADTNVEITVKYTAPAGTTDPTPTNEEITVKVVVDGQVVSFEAIDKGEDVEKKIYESDALPENYKVTVQVGDTITDVTSGFNGTVKVSAPEENVVIVVTTTPAPEVEESTQRKVDVYVDGALVDSYALEKNATTSKDLTTYTTKEIDHIEVNDVTTALNADNKTVNVPTNDDVRIDIITKTPNAVEVKDDQIKLVVKLDGNIISNEVVDKAADMDEYITRVVDAPEGKEIVSTKVYQEGNDVSDDDYVEIVQTTTRSSTTIYGIDKDTVIEVTTKIESIPEDELVRVYLQLDDGTIVEKVSTRVGSNATISFNTGDDDVIKYVFINSGEALIDDNGDLGFEVESYKTDLPNTSGIETTSGSIKLTNIKSDILVRVLTGEKGVTLTDVDIDGDGDPDINITDPTDPTDPYGPKYEVDKDGDGIPDGDYDDDWNYTPKRPVISGSSSYNPPKTGVSTNNTYKYLLLSLLAIVLSHINKNNY